MTALASAFSRIDDPLRNLPGDGSLFELVRMLRDPTGFFHERFEKHGRVFRSRLVFPCVFVVGEEANRTVLITRRVDLSFGQGYAQTAVRRIFENSIMLQDGDEHAHTRGILGPAVGRLSVRDSAKRVHAIWARAIDDASRARSADVYDLAQRTTFDVAANALIGLELGDETDRFRPYFESLIDGILAPVPIRFPFGKLDRALHARSALVAMLRRPIEEARTRPPEGLVGVLAHHREPDGSVIPTDEIAHQLLLLAWAGYDTTASAASWVLHVLAQRPDWQQRIRAEVARAGDDFAAIDSSKDFPQLDWFFLEIERMYPSAIFFPRVALEDVVLHGVTIPAGAIVFYCPYMSGRDPASFEHPNAFDPDRWNPERGAARPSPAKLFGFGGGPRVCLGKAFARLQLKLMTHTLLTRFRVEPDPLHHWHVMGLPVHHPVGFGIRLEPLH